MLDNDKLHVDFKPLFECIHIYATLDSLDELQRSYQADRKVIDLRYTTYECSDSVIQAQSDLILPMPLPLSSLPSLTQEISGFFIVESHVLETTGAFRSERDVEELWDALVMRLSTAIEGALRIETDPDAFLKVKECLIGFIMTLEVTMNLNTSLPANILSGARHPYIRRHLSTPSFSFYSRSTRRC